MFLEIYFLSIEDFINEIFFQCFKMFIIINNISIFLLIIFTIIQNYLSFINFIYIIHTVTKINLYNI